MGNNILKRILPLVLFIFLAVPSLTPLSAQLYRPSSPLSLFSLSVRLESAVWLIFTFIVVVCFVISGVLFLTARGDPGKLTIARSSFIWGVVGVVVGIVAYSILRIISIILI